VQITFTAVSTQASLGTWTLVHHTNLFLRTVTFLRTLSTC